MLLIFLSWRLITHCTDRWFAIILIYQGSDVARIEFASRINWLDQLFSIFATASIFPERSVRENVTGRNRWRSFPPDSSREPWVVEHWKKLSGPHSFSFLATRQGIDAYIRTRDVSIVLRATHLPWSLQQKKKKAFVLWPHRNTGSVFRISATTSTSPVDHRVDRVFAATRFNRAVVFIDRLFTSTLSR